MENPCPGPNEVGDSNWLAVIDGEASPTVMEHVARCAACAAEVESLRRTLLFVNAAFQHTECPTSETLLSYQAKLLPPDEAALLEPHLQHCPTCQEELRLYGAVPYPPGVEPRKSLLERLRQLGRRVMEATLVPTPTAALVTRGRKAKSQLYRVEGYELVLATRPPPLPGERWSIEGQLTFEGSLPEIPPGSRAYLHREGELVTEGPIDELGYFAMAEVPPGAYVLELALESVTIIPDEVILA